MSPVPILDDAYMERRRQLAYFRSMTDSYRSFLRPDTAEALRDDYALGRIDFEEFERRLAAVLRP